MVDVLKAAAQSVFEPRQDVRLVYLYGSTARGQARPGSDVDIGVVLDHSVPPGSQLKLELELELETALAAAGVPNADVRVLNNAPLLLQGEVMAEGRLLCARDEDERIAYEASTRSRYFDYLPAARAMAQTFAGALAERLRAHETAPGRGEWPA